MDQLRIEAKEISMFFEEKIIFEKLNWNGKGGDFWAIEGKNGAGKSTLLKILAGILKPSDGEVHWNEKNLEHISIRDRKNYIGYMPSKRMLSGWIDVETAIEVGAKAGMLSKTENLLQEFELIEKRSQLIQSLSDGEYVRMQLVRLILQDPDVVLLDEPAAMLDSAWRKKVYEYLSQWARRGKVVVICSHELELNKLYCNQILHL